MDYFKGIGYRTPNKLIRWTNMSVTSQNWIMVQRPKAVVFSSKHGRFFAKFSSLL